jgi:hypothetical protein
MEPVDDILIPPPAPESNRICTRHLVRGLAFVLMSVAAVCGNQIYHADILAPAAQRTADTVGVGLVFVFGMLLWWVAGRKISEMNRPLFRHASDAPDELRIDRHNILWIVASLLAGFIGLCAVTFGGTLALRSKELLTAYPVLRELNLSPRPILIIGGLLIALSMVALGLAMRRRTK